MATRQTLGFLILIVPMLSACLQQGQPIVSDRSVSSPQREVRVTRPEVAAKPTARVPVQDTSTAVTSGARSGSNYVVSRGDTLYSIAWRFSLDPQKLAYANRIRPPYTIYPGQRLKLKEATPPLRSGRASTQKTRPKVTRPSPRTPTDETATPLLKQAWQWPVPFKPTRGFSSSNKGADFELPAGRRVSVVASNAGKVVYAGNGIGGFEQLVIIKHSETLLSAYSFNGKIGVDEQSMVKAGQKLADILPVGRAYQKLRFEIRRDGTPINPGTFIN